MMKSPTNGLKNHWYAVEFASQVGKSDLYAFDLFGESWVLFRNSEGIVGCLKDECAHRACPLSLGTVIEGVVQCAYHGWQYGTNGQCQYMPSCKQTKASVKSLPCIEAASFIWVWPGNKEPTELPQPVETVPEGFQVHAELTMDLPIEHGLLLDNLLDLAHAPFTHTGTFAKGWSVPDLVKFLTPPKTSLKGQWDPYPIEMSFEPPCYVVSKIGLRGSSSGQKHLHQIHCCLPVDSQTTRLLYRLSLDFFSWARFIPGKDRFWRLLANRVMNEDLRLVIGQQERMLAGGNIWKTPVSYDKLGIGYRHWRRKVERQNNVTSEVAVPEVVSGIISR